MRRARSPAEVRVVAANVRFCRRQSVRQCPGLCRSSPMSNWTDGGGPCGLREATDGRLGLPPTQGSWVRTGPMKRAIGESLPTPTPGLSLMGPSAVASGRVPRTHFCRHAICPAVDGYRACAHTGGRCCRRGEAMCHPSAAARRSRTSPTSPGTSAPAARCLTRGACRSALTPHGYVAPGTA
jgi:hypothetical protein